MLFIMAVIAVATWVALDLVKAYLLDRGVDDKKNCVGMFDTIPCHQLKIEKLLLESRAERLQTK